jgi:hypothetical protein
MQLLTVVLLQKSTSEIVINTAEALALKTRIMAAISTIAQASPIFTLINQIAKLEATLAPSKALYHQCQSLRLELLNADWFRNLCIMHPKKFAETLTSIANDNQQNPVVMTILMQSGLLVLDLDFAGKVDYVYRANQVLLLY